MRFGTTGYFLGIVKITSNFQTYYIRDKKNPILFCETRLAPGRPQSQKQKPLTRIIIYFMNTLGTQAVSYYIKGDYVLVQGRLRLFKKQRKIDTQKLDFFSPKEYHLHVFKMALIHRAK